MNRKQARDAAMKIIFQMEAQGAFSPEKALEILQSEDYGAQTQYVAKLMNQMCENKEEIDALINSNSTGWPVFRMPKTDLAIARLAVCEIIFFDDIPKAVSVNEAVEMAKVYGTEQSPGFMNALLKKIG